MTDDFEGQAAGFLGMWVGSIPTETRFFDLKSVQGLSEEYAIPEEFSMVVLLVLEFSALSYWQETERSKTDNKARRKNLLGLEKAATKMVSVLDEMPPDTWRVLHEANIARGFRHHSTKKVVERVVQSMISPQVRDIEAQAVGDGKENEIERLKKELEAIADDARKAQKWMGAGKSGRPDDESAETLMQMCFMVWTEIIGREFTLAWHKNSPDSDAARFCVDVAAIVDTKLSSSRITTASRKAREAGIGIKDLGKLIEEADELRKRLE